MSIFMARREEVVRTDRNALLLLVVSVEIAKMKLVAAIRIPRPSFENRLDILTRVEALLRLRDNRQVSQINLGACGAGNTPKHGRRTCDNCPFGINSHDLLQVPRTAVRDCT